MSSVKKGNRTAILLTESLPRSVITKVTQDLVPVTIELDTKGTLLSRSHLARKLVQTGVAYYFVFLENVLNINEEEKTPTFGNVSYKIQI